MAGKIKASLYSGKKFQPFCSVDVAAKRGRDVTFSSDTDDSFALIHILHTPSPLQKRPLKSIETPGRRGDYVSRL